MKKHLLFHFVALTAVFLIGAAAVFQASLVYAQDQTQEDESKCAMMTQKMEQMKEKKAQMQRQLDQQLQEMEAAEGDAKVTAMAQVIETLVEQRNQMMDMHQQMCQNMMGHMGGHMKMSMDKKGQDGMDKCPMMKKMQENNPGEAN